MDPNLVRLAEAYSTAMAKVGNAAAEVQAEAGVGAASESSDEHINTARGGCYSKCSEEPGMSDVGNIGGLWKKKISSIHVRISVCLAGHLICQ